MHTRNTRAMSTSLAVLLLCAITAVTAKVYQIKLSQGSDPTSMVVTWSTNGTSTYNSHVIYGTAKTSLRMLAEGGDGKSYTYQSYDAGQYIRANGGSYLPKYTSPLIHSVRLNNLVPGTTYYYRCGDIVCSDLSGVISFTTLPAVGSALNAKGLPLTFAVLADTSTNGFVNGSLFTGFMNETSLNIRTNPAVGMVLLPGDLSYAGKSYLSFQGVRISLNFIYKLRLLRLQCTSVGSLGQPELSYDADASFHGEKIVGIVYHQCQRLSKPRIIVILDDLIWLSLVYRSQLAITNRSKKSPQGKRIRLLKPVTSCLVTDLLYSVLSRLMEGSMQSYLRNDLKRHSDVKAQYSDQDMTSEIVFTVLMLVCMLLQSIVIILAFK